MPNEAIGKKSCLISEVSVSERNAALCGATSGQMTREAALAFSLIQNKIVFRYPLPKWGGGMRKTILLK
jgi:hypothetical protein